jgi:hypothetical protein
MSKETKFYCQCTLRKGNTSQVAWIPQCFAEVGRIVQIRNGEAWDDGWVVDFASTPLDAETVEKNERNYRKQRKASDVIFDDIKKANAEAARR